MYFIVFQHNYTIIYYIVNIYTTKHILILVFECKGTTAVYDDVCPLIMQILNKSVLFKDEYYVFINLHT